MRVKNMGFLILALVFCLGATVAEAVEKPKGFPDHPVTIMVGFGAGGSSDVGVRILAEALKKVIGQPVLVENKAGAGGQVMWTDFKNNSKPDGYTLALINVPNIQATIFDPVRKAAYTSRDFQMVANHVEDPGAIFVRTESPYKTFEDLLKEAKAKPGQIKASTTGIGGDDHLAVLDLQRKAGLNFNIVHLTDTPTALKNVLGGHTDIDFDNVGAFLPAVKSGLGRMLVILDDKRFPDAADVPTAREKGITVISSSTRGFVYPAGTPMGIVKYMEESIKKAMQDPEHVKRMKESGLNLRFMGVDEYTKFMEAQNERSKELISLYRK
ncbi:MAG: tripartite tricarboxylate transporter substrate binding protein [Thermodesulfobacteriota bacterium]